MDINTALKAIMYLEVTLSSTLLPADSLSNTPPSKTIMSRDNVSAAPKFPILPPILTDNIGNYHYQTNYLNQEW